MKKKFLALALSVSILSLVACGSNKTTGKMRENNEKIEVSKSSTSKKNITEKNSSTDHTKTEEKTFSSSTVVNDQTDKDSTQQSNLIDESTTFETTDNRTINSTEEAFAYVIEQLEIDNSNNDLYFIPTDDMNNDGYYHFVIHSKELEKQGGTGTVGKYTVSPEGKYSEGDHLNVSTDTQVSSNVSSQEVEYARVWLTVMGTQYKQWLTDPNSNFELHVVKQAPDTLVDPYDKGSAAFPKETVLLSGNASYQGSVVYSSNGDGSITKYSVPVHWQLEDRSPGSVRDITQKILNDTEIINIPVGNPDEINQLIQHMIIEN